MPTRILYWNIENFSLNKINSPFPAPGVAAGLQQGQDRLNHIINEVINPINPDIIVIVEVGIGGGNGDEGELIGLVGQQAVSTILNSLRNMPLNNVNPLDWCLIPPVIVGGWGPIGFLYGQGKKEAVAVYYRSDRVQFIGPYVLSNSGGGVRSLSPNEPGVLGGLVNYPAGWVNAFQGQGAGGRQHPAGGGGPAGAPVAAINVPENQFAGQYVYYDAPNPAQNLPLPVQLPVDRLRFPLNPDRSPYLTKFLEVNRGGVFARTINLFAVHTSPAFAAVAVRNLAGIPEVLQNIIGEVNVIVGDFNVDPFNNHQPYLNILAQGYAMALNPFTPVWNLDQARKPYCMTHILPSYVATPFNDNGVPVNPTHNVYPRFGYMGSNFPPQGAPHDTGAIDNIFIRDPALPQFQYTPTLVNTITGKPYQQIQGGQIIAQLRGGVVINTSLQNANSLQSPNGIDSTVVAAGIASRNFIRWRNFGRIRSTSDHLALAIDV